MIFFSGIESSLLFRWLTVQQCRFKNNAPANTGASFGTIFEQTYLGRLPVFLPFFLLLWVGSGLAALILFTIVLLARIVVLLPLTAGVLGILLLVLLHEYCLL
jgi:hypothetical protein